MRVNTIMLTLVNELSRAAGCCSHHGSACAQRTVPRVSHMLAFSGATRLEG